MVSTAPAYPTPSAVEPLDRVLGLDAGLGARASWLALLGALLLHGLGVAVVQARVTELGAFVASMRSELRQELLQSVAVTVEAPPPEPEPPPPPPEPAAPLAAPEPAPAEPPPPTAKAATAAPAPAAAQAAQVMTAAPDPADPVDFTGDTFTTGNAERYAGGTTSSTGTSRVAVKDPNARGDGAPGGTGVAPAAPPPPPAKDLSRPPGLTGGGWDCGFPPQADEAQINFAVVSIAVTVGPDGRARSVSVLRDPGYGFGARARQCAMAKRYSPGLDPAGQPTTRTTPPITVRFTR